MNRGFGRRRGGIGIPTIRRQHKKPHVAALMAGCFDYGFSDFLHVALRHRNVRSFIFANNFKENRTLQAQTP
jgi:hypothetical protein